MPPDLSSFLNRNPKIAEAITWETATGPLSWPSWSSAQKNDLKVAFEVVWKWVQGEHSSFPPGYGDPTPAQNMNAAFLKPGDFPATILSASDMWTLYIKNIAVSLVMEAGNFVKWKVKAETPENLALLFDSRIYSGFTKQTLNGASFTGYQIRFWGLPTDPLYTLKFLFSEKIIQDTRKETINSFIDWTKRMTHYLGGFSLSNAQHFWGYAGLPPISSVLMGTACTTNDAMYGVKRNWTAGCHGTASLFMHVLRTVNVPVKIIEPAHAYLMFPTENKFLDHADDPYNNLFLWQKLIKVPSENLLWPASLWDSLLGTPEAQTKNTGRSTIDLAVLYLSDALLNSHCSDLKLGLAHDKSNVFGKLKTIYSLEALEQTLLWSRLDSKIKELGGCSLVQETFAEEQNYTFTHEGKLMP